MGKSLYLYKFSLYDYNLYDTYNIIINNIEKEDTRIIIEGVNDNIIYGYYINEVNQKNMIYNYEYNDINTIIETKETVTLFSINLNNSIIDIYGEKNDVKCLILEISLLLDNNLSIEPMIVDFKKIIEKAIKLKFRINQIKLNDYPIQDNITATCIIDIDKFCNFLQFINLYYNNIETISVSIVKDLKLIVNKNAIIKIDGNLEIIKDSMKEIIDLCTN